MGMGLVFISVFLVAHYYNLDLTLLQKSGALIGPGILLLLSRAFLRGKTPLLSGGPDHA